MDQIDSLAYLCFFFMTLASSDYHSLVMDTRLSVPQAQLQEMGTLFPITFVP
jgi:hypothetical protein